MAAWLCAQGMFLDLAQAAAWGKMFFSYVQTESVGDAWRLTFDEEKPCGLCVVIQETRQKQSGNENEAQARWPENFRLLLALPERFCWRPTYPKPCHPWAESEYAESWPGLPAAPVPRTG